MSVAGYAPLESVIGSDQPFVFQFEVNRGAPRGPEVHFIRSPKAAAVTEVTFGHGALDVLRPPSFGTSTGSRRSRRRPVASADRRRPGGHGHGGVVRHRNDRDLAGRRAIELLDDRRRGGAEADGLLGPWQLSSAVRRGRAGRQLTAGRRPVLSADGRGAFSVGLARYGALPVYYVALVTSDDGASWTQLPVPPGASPDSFGGFRYEPDGALQAVFAASRIEHGKGGGFPLINAAETAQRDHWRWWRPGSRRSRRSRLSGGGTCVTLGPFLAGNCAMGISTQLLLRWLTVALAGRNPRTPRAGAAMRGPGAVLDRRRPASCSSTRSRRTC